MTARKYYFSRFVSCNLLLSILSIHLSMGMPVSFTVALSGITLLSPLLERIIYVSFKIPSASSSPGNFPWCSKLISLCSLYFISLNYNILQSIVIHLFISLSPCRPCLLKIRDVYFYTHWMGMGIRMRSEVVLEECSKH